MKRTMSLMMAMLMLTSLLASVSVFELEDEWNEEAGGRAGYEVELLGTMEPRPSMQDISGGIRNAVDVDEDINFLLVVLNSGTLDISELYISVDVTPTGTTTSVAGTGGSPDGAICDDNSINSAGNPVCWDTSYASGDYLGNGSYAVRNSLGDPLTWTPTVPGDYTVTIGLDPGEQDSDLTNNDLSFTVTVKDWYDIGLDLTWDNDDPDDTGENTGTGPHDFTLSAMVDGSASWDPRNVDLEITYGGSFQMQDSNGFDVSTFEGLACASQSECVFTARMGSPMSVEVYHNLSDESQPPPTPTNGTRDVPTYQVAETFSGTIKGNAAECSGACAMYVLARVVNYLSYELVATDYGGPGHEANIVNEMKEVNNSVDDRNANNEDLLNAYFGVYHDVSVTAVTVGTHHSPGGRLDAGNSALYATIAHSGSEQEVEYDWQVVFDIRDLGNNQVTTTPFVLDCDNPLDPDAMMSHANLGMAFPALPELTVCTPLILDPGMFSITARVTLIDATLTNTDTDPNGDDDCGTGTNPDCHVDMNSANDDRTSHYEVVNNGPFVTLTMEVADGPIMEGTSMDFSARALHTGQPDSDGDGETDAMMYDWSVDTTEQDIQFMSCAALSDCPSIMVNNFWQGTPTVSVTVTDHWGATSTDTVTLKVWNGFSNNFDGAADVAYDIVYYGSLPQVVNFSDADGVDADLTGLGSSFTSVAAFSTDVSSILSPGDVYSEDMDVSFAGTSDTQYSLWYQGTTGWVSMPSTQSQVDSSTMMLSWSNDGSQPSRSSSTYAVFAGANIGEPPQTGITGLSHTLAPGGVIAISWSVSDAAAIGADDFGVIIIDGVRNTFPLGTTTWEIYGAHGTTYSYTVQVENGQSDSAGERLVGSPVASDSATADGQVDPAAGASDLTAAEEAGNMVAFTWNAADDSDVDHWVVCWSIGDHDADEVQGLLDAENSCSASGDKTSSHVSWRPSAAGTYHYSVTAVDSVGNMETAASSTALTVVGDETINWDSVPNIGTEGGDDPIPQSAWIAIGILVLVAVIAGAFILTRGGGEGGDEEWDY